MQKIHESQEQKFDLIIIDQKSCESPKIQPIDAWIQSQISPPKMLIISSEPSVIEYTKAQHHAFDILAKPIKTNALKRVMAKVMHPETKQPKQNILSPSTATEPEQFEGEVLLVEDTQVNQKVTSILLSSLGVNVTLQPMEKQQFAAAKKTIRFNLHGL